MTRRRFLIPALLALTTIQTARAADDKPIVVFDTTAGLITVELDRTKAPLSVENFLKYVDKGYYDGLIFHRVISDFMIQGGGFTEVGGKLKEKGQTMDPVKNESGNGLSNARGTIAMARTRALNSATAQFYINVSDTHRASLDGGQYAVFGKVIDGMDVVDAIVKSQTVSKTDARGVPFDDVPAKTITIKSAKRKS